MHDDEVLVKIKLCGLCNWEQNFWVGTGGPDSFYNSYKGVLGHEWAGTVEEVGANVTSLKKGDKVTYLPGSEYGGFSEYSVFKRLILFDCVVIVFSNADKDLSSLFFLTYFSQIQERRIC